jgi:Primase X
MLIDTFFAYLLDREQQELKIDTYSNNRQRDHDYQDNCIILWIELILRNPLSDHRKYVIWRIISPYLLNVRKLSLEESYCVTKEWLDKCNKLERLDFNAKLRIKEGLKGARKGYLPIGPRN